MPRAKGTKQVNATCPPLLLAEARQAARAEEKSFSEWIRDAMREKLERAGCPIKER